MENQILKKVGIPAVYPTVADIISRHGATVYYTRNDPTAGPMVGVPNAGGKFVGWYQKDPHRDGYVLRATTKIMPQAQIWPAAKAFAEDSGLGGFGSFGQDTPATPGIAEWGYRVTRATGAGEPPIVPMPGHQWVMVSAGPDETVWEVVTLEGKRKTRFPWKFAIGALLVGIVAGAVSQANS